MSNGDDDLGFFGRFLQAVNKFIDNVDVDQLAELFGLVTKCFALQHAGSSDNGESVLLDVARSRRKVRPVERASIAIRARKLGLPRPRKIAKAMIETAKQESDENLRMEYQQLRLTVTD